MKKPIEFDATLNIVSKGLNDKGEFHVVGYAATSDLDLQGDIITPEALKASAGDLLENSTALLFHDEESPIGHVVKQELDENGTLVDIIIDQTSKIPKTGMLVVDAIKQNILNKFSIRAKVLDKAKEFNEGLGQMVNTIKRMMLIEVSLVSIPANPEAKSLAWYISKAMKGSSMSEDTKILNEDGLPKIDETGGDGEATPAGFPAPEVLEKKWHEECDESELNGESDDTEVREVWDTFCEKNAFPKGFDYPYLSKGADGMKAREIAFVVNSAKSDELSEATKGAFQRISTLAGELVGKSYPYPGSVGFAPISGSTESPVESEVVAKSLKAISSLERKITVLEKKLDKAQADGAPVVRKGLGDKPGDDENLSGSEILEKSLEGLSPQDQLKVVLKAGGYDK